jgi:hypothetical protein
MRPSIRRPKTLLLIGGLLFIFLMGFFAVTTLAQQSEWSKSFTDSSGRGNEIIKTNGGCYVVTGVSHRFFLLAKADSTGKVLWWRTYQTGEATCTIQTSDEGYAIAGSGEVNFLKTDPEGNVEWTKNFMNGSTSFKINSVAQTSDNGYILAGYTPSGNSPQWDLIIKTDSNGTVIWSKSFGTERAQSFATNILTTQNGYILAANSRLYGLDSNGDIKWSEPSIVASSLSRTSDGGYLLVSGTGSTITKTDSNGKEHWSKTFKLGSSQNIYNYLRSAVETQDGGVIACGTAYPNYVGIAWIVKTDAQGNEVWNTTAAPFSGHDSQASSIIQNGDGSYLITGAINNVSNSSFNEVWLVKLSSNILHPTSANIPTTGISAYTSPSPTVPEFSLMAILAMFLAISVLALLKTKRGNGMRI